MAMSRETQFIGLTRAAEEFVSTLSTRKSDHHAVGMFDEEIPLRKWEMHPVFKERWPNYDSDRPTACIREIVQCQPWSSGPMIFTCLEIDWGNGAQSTCFQWVDDPSLSSAFCQHDEDERWREEHGDEPCRVTVSGSEFDRENGTMWV